MANRQGPRKSTGTVGKTMERSNASEKLPFDALSTKQKKQKSSIARESQSDTLASASSNPSASQEAPMAPMAAPMAPRREVSKEPPFTPRVSSTDSKEDEMSPTQKQLTMARLDINMNMGQVEKTRTDYDELLKNEKYVRAWKLAKSARVDDKRSKDFYSMQCKLIPRDTFSTMEAENAEYKFRDQIIREREAVLKYNRDLSLWPNDTDVPRPPEPITDRHNNEERETYHWVEIGNLYVTPLETGAGAWKSLVKAKFVLDKATDFVIYTGSHGNSGGQHLDSKGNLDENYRDETHTDTDHEAADKLMSADTEKQLKIKVIDVFDETHDVRNPEKFKQHVRDNINKGKTVIIAWCFSLDAFTVRKDTPRVDSNSDEMALVEARNQKTIGDIVEEQFTDF